MSDNLLAASPPKPIFTPRQICSFYFKPCLDNEGEPTGYYARKTCGKCRKHTPQTGYTNLVSMSGPSILTTRAICVTLASPRAEHYCHGYTKLNPISVTTLTSLMEPLTKAVETTIGEEMPDVTGVTHK
ncbi:hypothetical protein PC128_g14995 [Phytophthora cactorum]|nr:hypothetical protein PC120_g11844 [Phytophthora cactorum]KAG3060586.1 hypothetical protein PC121_g13384 [Phytophthora cactorum]KAG3181701.1 hypothetical protein PC128_g14995 [Phytophthora cactorum]KAG4053395.1 hypothetical protein PC123_g11453 [Phytophthora cactorum]